MGPGGSDLLGEFAGLGFVDERDHLLELVHAHLIGGDTFSTAVQFVRLY